MEEIIQNIQFTNIWWAFIAPATLMVLDFITGFYRAWKNKEVSSSKMRDGIGKKVAELCYIAVGVLAKFALSLDPIMYGIIFYICYMEIISLVENCEKLNFPMPKSWKEKLNNKEGE